MAEQTEPQKIMTFGVVITLLALQIVIIPGSYFISNVTSWNYLNSYLYCICACLTGAILATVRYS